MFTAQERSLFPEFGHLAVLPLDLSSREATLSLQTGVQVPAVGVESFWRPMPSGQATSISMLKELTGNRPTEFSNE